MSPIWPGKSVSSTVMFDYDAPSIIIRIYSRHPLAPLFKLTQSPAGLAKFISQQQRSELIYKIYPLLSQSINEDISNFCDLQVTWLELNKWQSRAFTLFVNNFKPRLMDQKTTLSRSDSTRETWNWDLCYLACLFTRWKIHHSSDCNVLAARLSILTTELAVGDTKQRIDWLSTTKPHILEQ